MKIGKGILMLMLAAVSMIGRAQETQQPKNTYQLYKFPLKHSFIALSPLPGRVDLDADLAQITSNKITNVVTLVSDEELVKYKVPNLLTRYESLDLNVLHSPIVDYGLPDIAQMKSILNWVQKKVKAKENILIHCVGGLGRSGTVMAIYAKVYLGKTGQEAIDFVRSIRGNEAVETQEQQDFVKNW